VGREYIGAGLGDGRVEEGAAVEGRDRGRKVQED
jgi:hypothetical protein